MDKTCKNCKTWAPVPDTATFTHNSVKYKDEGVCRGMHSDKFRVEISWIHSLPSWVNKGTMESYLITKETFYCSGHSTE